MPRIRTVPLAAASPGPSAQRRPPPLSLGNSTSARARKSGGYDTVFRRDRQHAVARTARPVPLKPPKSTSSPFRHGCARRWRGRQRPCARARRTAQHRHAPGACSARRRRRAAGGWLVPLLEARLLEEAQAEAQLRCGRLQLARELRGSVRAASRPAGIRAHASARQAEAAAQAAARARIGRAPRPDAARAATRAHARLKTACRDEHRRAALETREIYAPLASRLGIWQLKWELEDLAFRFSAAGRLQAHRRLAARQARRTRAVHRGRQRELGATLRCRRHRRARSPAGPKHIYSIWRKMQRK